jgi:hypothetical protein
MDISQLLQIKEVQTVGLLLAFIVVMGGLILTGKWPTPKEMQALEKQCSDLKETLKAATDENKICAKDYTDARILIARMEEREAMTLRSKSRST